MTKRLKKNNFQEKKDLTKMIKEKYIISNVELKDLTADDKD